MASKASGQVTVVDVTDAYSVLLTSESYTFIGNTTGAPSGLSCTTQVVAYCGAQQCSKVSVSTVTCPTGISATITNNNTVSPTITFKTTATITAACEATIPVVVDGVTVNKKFSFAVAKQGTQGNTGATGKGISSVTPQYYISTSKISATGGSWSDTAPTTVAKGKYLWTRMKVIYTNPTSTEYTTATYDSMTDSRIEQLKDSITLEITGPDGVKSSIAMDDEGKITLTGDVMAQRINVNELMAQHLTSTGGLNVTGDFVIENDNMWMHSDQYGTFFSNGADGGTGNTNGTIALTKDGCAALESQESTAESVVQCRAGDVTIKGTNEILFDGSVTMNKSLTINSGQPVLSAVVKENNYGIVINNSDGGWIRTPQDGLLPYGSGGQSYVGSAGWPFSAAYINQLNSPGAHNFIFATNEISFVPSGYDNNIWINYRTQGGTNGNIGRYIFGNGKAGGASIDCSNLYVNDSLMTDFVVAQGWSGDWWYRKWASGRAECWGYQYKSITIPYAYNSGVCYGSDLFGSISYPFTISYPRPFVTPTCSGNSVWIGSGPYDGSDNTLPAYRIFHAQAVNSSVGVTMLIYVSGFWK